MSKRAVGILVATIALILTASVSLPAAAQTFDEAFAAYERGDYAAAYRGFRPIAERGDARAQYYLGQLYRSGLGVPQDFAAAARWYGHAAEQGDDMAQSNLGFRYQTGEGVPQSYEEAMRWYRRAAAQGNAIARNNIGDLYKSAGASGRTGPKPRAGSATPPCRAFPWPSTISGVCTSGATAFRGISSGRTNGSALRPPAPRPGKRNSAGMRCRTGTAWRPA